MFDIKWDKRLKKVMHYCSKNKRRENEKKRKIILHISLECVKKKKEIVQITVSLKGQTMEECLTLTGVDGLENY